MILEVTALVTSLSLVVDIALIQVVCVINVTNRNYRIDLLYMFYPTCLVPVYLGVV